MRAFGRDVALGWHKTPVQGRDASLWQLNWRVLMTRITHIGLAMAIALSVNAGRCRAATFSSSIPAPRSGEFPLRMTSFVQSQGSKEYINPVTAGVDELSLSVDTVTDWATITNLVFHGPSMQPKTLTTVYNVDFLLTIPGNFPDPPTARRVQGRYEERITFESLITTTPTHPGPSLPGVIYNAYPYDGSKYETAEALPNLTLPNLTFTGTYQVVGPKTTVTTPFSIESARTFPSLTRAGASYIYGSPNFGNGFAFTPNSLRVTYQPVGSSTIFRGVVDDVQFELTGGGIDINYFAGPVPEPSGLISAAIAAAFVGLRARRRWRLPM
jgi:hypothetical protein